MKHSTIGTASSWNPMVPPPCQTPGCRNAAVTIGEIGKGKVGNVCAKCASRSAARRQRRGRR